MATIMNRVMISIPLEIKKEIEQLKQTEFFDKPYAELYRQILRVGLEHMHKDDNK